MQIDLDQVLDIALLGVRRAAVFMGFGLNAASDPALRDFQLTRQTGIALVPEAASEEVLAEYKREFAAWITSNGVREMVEAYATFLDRIYSVCLQILVATGKREAVSATRSVQTFEQLGVTKKLKRLASECAITGDHRLLEALTAVRNCLSHRRGIVSEGDCNVPHALSLAWKGLELRIEQVGGPNIPIELPFQQPVLVERGGNVVAGWTERRVEFPIGTIVRLEPRRLAEIAIWVIEEARQVYQGTLVFARSSGVTINDESASHGS